ncbi:hypothetical protein EVAR_66408_1 [Eumeta japonica]|uniref:Uncharacterized protein n=1 Tax=Eumeta variegata TaxID=151549 RepID=A0A4C2ADW8_EUMVA|nr:hypothetical protein EVAR_66408_1 [Eumeta japonica]
MEPIQFSAISVYRLHKHQISGPDPIAHYQTANKDTCRQRQKDKLIMRLTEIPVVTRPGHVAGEVGRQSPRSGCRPIADARAVGTDSGHQRRAERRARNAACVQARRPIMNTDLLVLMYTAPRQRSAD